jgi:hypothetical protein
MAGIKSKKHSVRNVAGSGVPGQPDQEPARMPIDVYVGARLRHFRELVGMELSEVGAEIRTSGHSIGEYESGRQRPPAGDLIALAGLFGVGLDQLFPEDSARISGRLH